MSDQQFTPEKKEPWYKKYLTEKNITLALAVIFGLIITIVISNIISKADKVNDEMDEKLLQATKPLHDAMDDIRDQNLQIIISQDSMNEQYKTAMLFLDNKIDETQKRLENKIRLYDKKIADLNKLDAGGLAEFFKNYKSPYASDADRYDSTTRIR